MILSIVAIYPSTIFEQLFLPSYEPFLAYKRGIFSCSQFRDEDSESSKKLGNWGGVKEGAGEGARDARLGEALEDMLRLNCPASLPRSRDAGPRSNASRPNRARKR